MKAGKKAKTYEMDMCSGPIFIKIVVFAVPLILSDNVWEGEGRSKKKRKKREKGAMQRTEKP